MSCCTYCLDENIDRLKLVQICKTGFAELMIDARTIITTRHHGSKNMNSTEKSLFLLAANLNSPLQDRSSLGFRQPINL